MSGVLSSRGFLSSGANFNGISSISKDSNILYVIIVEEKINFYKIIRSTNTVSIIYEEDYQLGLTYYDFSGSFKKISGEIFYQFTYNENSPAIPLNQISSVNVGRIINDEIINKKIKFYN